MIRSLHAPVLAGLSSCLLLVTVVITWGGQARLSEAIIATGRVRPAGNPLAVQATETSRIVAVHVADGQPVEAGQILVTLDATDLETRRLLVCGELAARRADRSRLVVEAGVGVEGRSVAWAGQFPRLRFLDEGRECAPPSVVEQVRDEAQAAHDLAHAELDQSLRLIDGQSRTVRAEAEGQNALAEAAERQLDLLRPDIAAAGALQAKGLEVLDRLRVLEREEARLTGLAAEARAGGLVALARLSELRLEAVLAKTEARRRAAGLLAEASGRIRALEQDLAQIELQIAARHLAAPIDGVVEGLGAAGPGVVVRPAEPVLTIVPESGPKRVVARVEAARADRMQPGSPAWLRFPAGSAQGSDPVPARVVRIAADSAPDPGTGRLLYEVDLEILRAPDKEGPVPIAGAPAEVYIPLDARTPLALLLDPLTAYFARAFRS